MKKYVQSGHIGTPPKRNYANEFVDLIMSGKLRDRVMFGIVDKNGGTWKTEDFGRTPGGIWAGGMGSGKSYSAAVTLSTWLATNWEHTKLFLIDPIAGMNDYKSLFDGSLYGMEPGVRPFPQVYTCFDSEDMVFKAIDLCYQEMENRGKVFNAFKAKDLYDYEKLVRDPAARARAQKANPSLNIPERIDRIIMVFEEFHTIPYAMLEWDKSVKIDGTPANKFQKISRIGRKFGVWLCCASQKTTSSDIPPGVVASIMNKIIMKVSTAEANYVLRHDGPSRLKASQKGRGYCDEGLIQCPDLSVDMQVKLLKQLVGAPQSGSVYLTDERITQYLSGFEDEDLYAAKTMKNLIQDIASLNGRVVLSTMHRRMGYETTKRNSEIDQFGLAHTIENKDGRSIAVMYREQGQKISLSQFTSLRKAIKEEGHDGAILYTMLETVPDRTYTSARDSQILIYTIEDMRRMAARVDEDIKEDFFGILQKIRDAREAEERESEDDKQSRKKGGRKSQLSEIDEPDQEYDDGDDRRMSSELQNEIMQTLSGNRPNSERATRREREKVAMSILKGAKKHSLGVFKNTFFEDAEAASDFVYVDDEVPLADGTYHEDPIDSEETDGDWD